MCHVLALGFGHGINKVWYKNEWPALILQISFHKRLWISILIHVMIWAKSKKVPSSKTASSSLSPSSSPSPSPLLSTKYNHQPPPSPSSSSPPSSSSLSSSSSSSSSSSYFNYNSIEIRKRINSYIRYNIDCSYSFLGITLTHCGLVTPYGQYWLK